MWVSVSPRPGLHPRPGAGWAPTPPPSRRPKRDGRAGLMLPSCTRTALGFGQVPSPTKLAVLVEKQREPGSCTSAGLGMTPPDPPHLSSWLRAVSHKNACCMQAAAAMPSAATQAGHPRTTVARLHTLPPKSAVRPSPGSCWVRLRPPPPATAPRSGRGGRSRGPAAT